MRKSECARAVRKYEILLKPIQFSTDSYLPWANSTASWTVHEILIFPATLFISIDMAHERLVTINRSGRALGNPPVASSTSARRRRENRLLSLGMLIITHANESRSSTTVANARVRSCESGSAAKRWLVCHEREMLEEATDGTWLAFAIIGRNRDANKHRIN